MKLKLMSHIQVVQMVESEAELQTVYTSCEKPHVDWWLLPVWEK